MALKKPIIAIVGPPNAGKSTLLNKIAGKPLAITSEVAGTTRDRQYVETSWNGVDFVLADTAGLSDRASDELETNVLKQVDIAIEEADIILLIMDGKEPARRLSAPLLKKFRNSKKPVVLAVNKLDSPKKRDFDLLEFRKLGVKKMFAVSAISGLGVGDLLDALAEAAEKFVKEIPGPETTPNMISVAIVGKPNVGKSSLFNKILKDERSVVSAVPGTTRNSVDSRIKIGDTIFNFIDTAGLKKKEHRQEQPDVFSGFQTFKSIRRSDVCLFVIDTNEPITKQDQRVAQEIFAMDKGCVILANKIDAYDSAVPLSSKTAKKSKNQKGKTDDSYQTLRDLVSHHFPFLWLCPMFFVSAKTGEGLDEALKAVKPIFEARHKNIEQTELDSFLQQKLKTNPPKLLRDQKTPKVFSLSQLETNPPMFQLYVNHPAAISMQFRKFLENAIIKELGFWGTPIKLKLLGKDKK